MASKNLPSPRKSGHPAIYRFYRLSPAILEAGANTRIVWKIKGQRVYFVATGERLDNFFLSRPERYCIAHPSQ
jgi:hypothetical protein